MLAATIHLAHGAGAHAANALGLLLLGFVIVAIFGPIMYGLVRGLQSLRAKPVLNTHEDCQRLGVCFCPWDER